MTLKQKGEGDDKETHILTPVKITYIIFGAVVCLSRKAMRGWSLALLVSFFHPLLNENVFIVRVNSNSSWLEFELELRVRTRTRVNSQLDTIVGLLFFIILHTINRTVWQGKVVSYRTTTVFRYNAFCTLYRYHTTCSQKWLARAQ